MGWFSKKPTVTEAVEGVGRVALDIRSAITGKADPATRLEYELKFRELEQHLATLQAEINKAEATHPSRFVAGWRPFVGWVCGCAFALPLVLVLWRGLVAIFAPNSDQLDALGDVLTSVRDLGTAFYLPVLLGMLGLSVNRTWEKLKGIDTRKINPEGGE